jgi:hypothetical protein
MSDHHHEHHDEHHHEEKEEKRELKRHERIKLRQLEFKENNKHSLCIVNLVSTVLTVGLAIATLAILKSDPTKCDASHLRITLWLMLGMHLVNTVEAVCGLTGFDKIFCGCICTIGFFVYEVAVLVYMQVVFYSSGPCEQQTPVQYWWLLGNIIVYFGFLAVACYYHIRGMFGGPSEQELEEEERRERKNSHGEEKGHAMH